jgi:hypothetical protein
MNKGEQVIRRVDVVKKVGAMLDQYSSRHIDVVSCRHWVSKNMLKKDDGEKQRYSRKGCRLSYLPKAIHIIKGELALEECHEPFEAKEQWRKSLCLILVYRSISPKLTTPSSLS